MVKAKSTPISPNSIPGSMIKRSWPERTGPVAIPLSKKEIRKNVNL